MSLFNRIFPAPPQSSDSQATASPRGPLLKPDGTPFELALYAYDGCPYCQRVSRTLDRLGIEVEMRNVLRDRSHRDDLIQATGRSTVPVLFIDGEFMSESSDIIRWLTDRSAEQPG